jgi:hypothetical protein
MKQENINFSFDIRIVPAGSLSASSNQTFPANDGSDESARPLYGFPTETVRLEPSVLSSEEIEVL